MSCRWLLASSLSAAALTVSALSAAQPPAEPPPAEPPPADVPPTDVPSADVTPPPDPSPAPEPAPAPVAPASPVAPAPLQFGPAQPVPAGEPPADEALEDEPPVGDQPLGSHQTHFRVQFGIRTSYITDEGYGLFSRTVDRIGDNYPVVQPSLAVGIAPLAMGDLSLAFIGMWEYGGDSSELRGEETDLDFHHLALGVELRYHVAPWLYGFAAVAPGAVNTRASLRDSSVGHSLYSRAWSFSLDATAGAAFQLYGKRSGASNRARLWAILEGGYGWTTSVDLSFEPEEDDETVPQRMEALDLGTLAIRGPMFRISAALTF